ncbi:MAG: hypothetical protein F6K11_15020 [Leptolyngbya sp. SIO3F4]|nr:hypothetical protein [Leptolyngbya sp. SIO3F4]
MESSQVVQSQSMKTIFIFGAGASYGAYGGKPRTRSIDLTPLTANLFGHPKFNTGISKAKNLTNLLEQARIIEGNTFDLEKSLARLIEKRSEERLKSLLDLRFALHSVIRNTAISGSGTPSLYEDLWYRVKVSFEDGGKVLFVNMNYDTILDQAISQSEGAISSFDAYISSESWGLVHPHGAISWGYETPKEFAGLNSRTAILEKAMAIENVSLRLIHLKNDFPIENINLLNQNLSSSRIPALALPVAGTLEKEKFVSPPEHIEYIKGFADKFSNLVLIGWRGLDPHILSLISPKGKRKLKNIHVVSNSKTGAVSTLDILRQSGFSGENEVAIDGGFENYVKSSEFAQLYPNPALGNGVRG